MEGLKTPQDITNIPHLARTALFKQMLDYRSSSRQSEIMGPVAQSLNDHEMVDVVAYFAAPSSTASATYAG
jgi:cytochrome c553